MRNNLQKMDMEQLKKVVAREILFFGIVMFLGIMIAQEAVGMPGGKDANIFGFAMYVFFQLMRLLIWATKTIFKSIFLKK